MLKPRLATLNTDRVRTLKDKQQANGRTLALNGVVWRRLRAAVLAGEPLCRHCAARGLTVIATDVDHMNGPADNRIEALQPLCKPCHSRKTQADMGKRVNYGCDVNGMPLDPAHPWNNEKSPETQRVEPTGTLSFNADCENP